MSSPTPSPATVADAAVAQARDELRGEYAELIAGVFHYGAVEIDTRHLVVWVILTSPPDALPVWCLEPAAAAIAEDLRRALLNMQAVVRSCLAQRSWPGADQVVVGFESAERIRTGGRSYFT